jgi:protein-S-isoprenylcysteine O-methyltransferase Ste14
MRARDTLGYRDWTTASAILLFFVAVYLAIELRRVRIEERPKT